MTELELKQACDIISWGEPRLKSWYESASDTEVTEMSDLLNKYEDWLYTQVLIECENETCH